MYISSRQIDAHQGKMTEAISVVNWVVAAINERHGGDMRISIEIGGNPNGIGITGLWESLGAYQAARTSYMADAEIGGAISMAAHVGDAVQDQLGQVIRPTGERAEFATVTFARVEVTEMAAAIPFVIEVAELASTVAETGAFRAVTGDAAGVGWVSYADSLQTIQDNDDKLNANPDFLALYKKSASCMVSGSLVNTIRQYLN